MLEERCACKIVNTTQLWSEEALQQNWIH
jgi:hypothetical protein